jgi:AraC family transcriptional regulator
MLRYLGYGDRQFGVRPMYVHQRSNWEFFVLLKGRCRVTPSSLDDPEVRGGHLWVFPPDTAHGWIGTGVSVCRVAIFHFSAVPHLIERAVEARGFVGMALTAEQTRLIARMAEDVTPHYERMTEKSLLVFDRTRLDLSLMLLEAVPGERTESKSDFAVRKVEAGTTWYLEHMAQQPKLDEVASAINISERHLRRMFHEVRLKSPQAVFTQLRLQRAMELLAQTDHKLETIARECGFASNTDFSRVFKKHRNMTPDAWRRNASQLRGCASSLGVSRPKTKRSRC